MHLNKWVNFKYLYQNFKKSKTLLLFILVLVPIINIWMVGTNIISKDYVVDFSMLYKLSNIIAFILPTALAFILMGFVFKRKTVDFVMSKPISKKQIFISNFIGGFGFILVILLINSIGFIFLNLFTSLFIPFSVIIDYFCYSLVTYMFIFIISLLAIAISGNISGTFVVFLLLLLFGASISYINYDIKDKNTNIYYISESESYKADLTYDYTLITPLNYYRYETYNTNSIIKTLVLSVVYLGLAYIIFNKKLMENSEVSFKNKYLYNIIKILTYIPICYFAYLIFSSDNIFLIISIIICVVYYIVYDLILRKKLGNIYKKCGELLIVSIFIFGAFVLIGKLYDKDKLLDIPEVVTLEFNDYDFNYVYTIKINDKNLISELINDNIFDNYITMYFDNNYFISKGISESLYGKIINYADKNDLLDKYTTDNIIHITSANNKGLVLPLDNKFKNMVIDELNNYDSDKLEKEYIYLYKYEDHKIKYISLDIYNNLDILNYIKEIYNEEFLKNINNNTIFINSDIEYLDEIINENKDSFINFLEEHKNDKLTNDTLILYSGLDRYFINKDVFLLEYDKYVAKEE